MERRLKILFIERYPERQNLLRHYVEQAADIETVSRSEQLAVCLQRGPCDIIISDSHLEPEYLSVIEVQPIPPPVVFIEQLDIHRVRLDVRRGERCLGSGEVTPELFTKVIHYLLERQQVQQLKNDYVSMVSHELRTPLTILEESISQVSDGILGEVNEEQADTLRVALSSVERLSRIVNDLLDISKIEAGKVVLSKERVDLRAVVEDIRQAFAAHAKKCNLELRAHVPAQPVELFIDRDKVVQVLTNLVNNAIKFTPAGSVEIRLLDRGETVECSVIDTGRGISSDDLAKVFNRFEQMGKRAENGQRGTGLGLAISRGLVELHRGRLTVESSVGRGSRFSFILPRISQKEVVSEAVSQQLRSAKSTEEPFSVLVYHLADQAVAALSAHPFEIMSQLADHIRDALRRKSDHVQFERQNLYVFLPGTAANEARQVQQRLKVHLAARLIAYGPELESGLRQRLVSFPELSDEAVFLERLFEGFAPSRTLS